MLLLSLEELLSSDLKMLVAGLHDRSCLSGPNCMQSCHRTHYHSQQAELQAHFDQLPATHNHLV